jgi:hypothetical protein
MLYSDSKTSFREIKSRILKKVDWKYILLVV